MGVKDWHGRRRKKENGDNGWLAYVGFATTSEFGGVTDPVIL